MEKQRQADEDKMSTRQANDIMSIRMSTQTATSEVSTFERLNKQTTKALSDWHENAKKAKEEKELSECTFAPNIVARKNTLSNQKNNTV